VFVSILNIGLGWSLYFVDALYILDT